MISAPITKKSWSKRLRRGATFVRKGRIYVAEYDTKYILTGDINIRCQDCQLHVCGLVECFASNKYPIVWRFKNGLNPVTRTRIDG